MGRPPSRSVRQQYYLRSSPKKVFKAITNPNRLTRWFCDVAEFSPRKGGRYAFSWKDGPTHTGKVLEFAKGRGWTLTWEWPGLTDAGVTRFRLHVEPKGKGTLLRVLHSGLPVGKRWDDLYAGAVWGWTYFAMNLKSVVEHGYDLRSKYDG